MIDLPAFLGPTSVIEAPAEQAPAGELYNLALNGNPNPLPLVMQTSALSHWCWAATLASIETYYQTYFGGSAAESQCQIATRWLGLNCCPPGPNTEANPQNLSYALQTALGAYSGGVAGSSLPPVSVHQLIDNQQPICCAIQWSDGTGHFVVIAGYHITPQEEVIVRDPLYGEHTLPYDTFHDQYRGSGRWVDSYLTKSA